MNIGRLPVFAPLVIILFLAQSTFSQLSGTFSIPGSYPTLFAAITDLNLQGVNGPVVMDVLAGHTETVPVGGFTLTATGTSANTILFRKSGVGTNPLLTAYPGGTRTPGSASQDGIWSFVGCDYITIDGIDLFDPNASNPATMEYGFGFFKANAGDGCQNNSIRNCFITLNRGNNATGAGPSVDGSRGINLVNSLISSQTTVLTVTALSGCNSGNSFYGNTIQNCNIGIALIAYAAPAPFVLAERNNDVGGNNVTTGNSILNFGGGAVTNPAAAIRTLAQYDLNISYNLIQNNNGGGINHGTTLRGIYLNTAQSADVTVTHNSLSLQGGGSNTQLSVIENLSGASAASNSVIIENNLISNCNNSLNTTGTFYYIFNNGASSSFLSISGNTITGNNNPASSGTTYFIYNNAAVSGSIVLNNNLISSNTCSASTSGINYLIYNNSVSTANLQIQSNRILNNQIYANTGAVYHLYNSQATSAGISISSNTLQGNNQVNQSGSSFQLYNTGACSGNTDLSLNSILNNTLNLGAAAANYAIFNNSAPAANLSIQDNIYSDNELNSGSGTNGIFYLSGSPANVYNNLIFSGNLLSGNNFNSSLNSPYYLLYNNQCSSANLSISNNSIVSCSWTGTASPKFLVGNTGSVSAGPVLFNSNLFTALSNTTNLSGLFYGIYNTGLINGDLQASNNTFSGLQSNASTGASALIYNASSVTGQRNILFNQVNSIQFGATGNADFNGIFNSGNNSTSINLSSNSFSNIVVARASGLSSLIQNAGPVATTIGTVSLSNNQVDNYTTVFSQNGGAFMFYNNGVSAEELRILSNVVLNCSSTQSNGACHIFYNRGVLTNTFTLVNISDNLLQQFAFGSNGNGAFYPFYNNGVSCNDLSVTNNTLLSLNNSASLSSVQLIGNSGLSTSGIQIQSNLISAYGATLNNSGSLFFINNSAPGSAGTSILSNTILNPSGNFTTGDLYLIHNSGAAGSALIDIRNNFIQSLNCTQTGSGAFYGIYHNAANAGTLSISNNTLNSLFRQGGSGSAYFFYSRGIAGTTVNVQEIKNNLLSNFTSSMTAAGANYILNCAGGNVIEQSIESNSITNVGWNSTSSNRFLISNSAQVSTLNRIFSNKISNISGTSNTTGNFYGIQNAVPASAAQLSICANEFDDLQFSSSSGDVQLINSSGTQSGGVQVSQNSIQNFTVNTSLSGSIYGINNASATNSVLSVQSNTLRGAQLTYSTGSFYGYYNTSAQTQSIVFEQNQISDLNGSAASGAAYFIYNNAASSPYLGIRSNNISNIQYSLTNGALHFLYNRGTATNTFNFAEFTGNSLKNGTVSVSSIANQNYLLYNNGVNAASLSIASNTLSDFSWNTTLSGRYLIYNTGTSSLGISIVNNHLQNHNSPINSTGIFYGIYNNSGTSPQLQMNSNKLDLFQSQNSASFTYLLYNSANISSSLSIVSNSLSNCNVIGTGNSSFFGINNRSWSSGWVNISQNAISNHSLSTVNGTLGILYNSGVASNTAGIINITNNLISQVSLSTSANALLFGVANDAASTNSLNITGNSLSNLSSPSPGGNRLLIYNSAYCTDILSLSQNTISSSTFSTNSSGTLYGIANTGISQGTLSINNNYLNQLQFCPGTSSVFVISNTGNVSNHREISNNNLNAIQSYSSASGRYYGVYNLSHNSSYLAINGNTLNANNIHSGTVPLYMIYNTASPAVSVTVIDIIQNEINGGLQKIDGNAAYYGVFNNSVSTQSLNMNGNRFLNHILDVQQGNRYMLYNTSNSVSAISMSGNQFNNCNYSDTLSTAFYGILNAGRFSTQLSMNNNAMTSCTLSTRTSSLYVILNSARGVVNPNVLSISSNSIIANRFSIVQNRPLFLLHQLGDTITGIQFNNNSIVSNSMVVPSGELNVILNRGNQSQWLTMNGNLVNANFMQLSTNDLHVLRNNNLNSANISLNSNTISANQDNRAAGDTYLISNSGLAGTSLNYNLNSLSHIYTGTVFPYVGSFSGIYCPLSASATNVQINGNLFSSVTFSALTGLGPLYFIHNTADPAQLELQQNQWLNLQLKHAGPHYFIYNKGNVQSQLLVQQNVLNGYERQFAAASDFYFYFSDALNVPAACMQTFSANAISNISVSVPGVGLMAGFYSMDGGTSPFPRKIFQSNLIQNITSAGGGDFLGIYSNYLGQGTINLPSSISSNTIGNLNLAGNLFGLYPGTSTSPSLGPVIHSNVLSDLSSNGASAIIYPACLNLGMAPSYFYRNKIYGISVSGISSRAYGLYVGSTGSLEINNNRIGLIAAPSSTLQNPVNGICAAGGNSIQLNYNTVYLNTSGTAADFHSNALYVSSVQQLQLRNNILVNTSVANGSGLTVAFRRSSGNLNNYAVNSDRNIFYAGAGFSGNALYCSPAHTVTSLLNLQNIAGPREANSHKEPVPFSSTTGSLNSFLTIDPTLPSFSESGALNISGISDDFDLQPRQGNPGYAGTGTAPDIGSDEFNQNLPPCASVNTGTISPLSSTVCAGQRITLQSSGYSFNNAGGIIYQWQSSSISGGPFSNVNGGSAPNKTEYSSAPLTTGTLYFILTATCTNNSQTSTSNQATVVVLPIPSASLSITTTSLCSGGNTQMNLTTDIGISFLWSGPSNFSSTVQNPSLTNLPATAAGIYSVLVTAANTCTNAATGTLQIFPSVPQFSFSPLQPAICLGDSILLKSSIPANTATVFAGNQIAQNTANSYPAVYSQYFGGQKMQFLILASELSAAGFTLGSPVTGIEFPVASLGAAWGSTVFDCQNFCVSLGHTSLNNLTAFQSGMQVVMPSYNFTPVAPGFNSHLFSNPFLWDGSSNILVETVFSNNNTGNAAASVIQHHHSTGYQSTVVYRADNQDFNTLAAASVSNVNVGALRPDFRLIGAAVGNYTWSPSTGLVSVNSSSTLASPNVSQVYTVSLSNGTCSAINSLSLTVSIQPSVTVSSSSSLVCVGNTATLNAAGAGSYTWSNGALLPSIAVSPLGNSTFVVTGANAPCPTSSAAISLSVGPAMLVSALSNSPVICAGQSSTLYANGANTYSWSNGATTQTTVVSPLVNTTFTVTGSNGPGCFAQQIVTIQSNTLPAIQSAPASATLCAGESLELFASGAISYTWLPSGLSSPNLLIFPTAGITYTLLGQGSNQCVAQLPVPVSVDPCVKIPGQTVTLNVFKVYPNPSNGRFLLEAPEPGEFQLQLFDGQGRLIQSRTEIHKQIVLELETQAKGIYLLKIASGDRTEVFRLMLQ